MATVKKESGKKKIINDNHIISLYMNHVLENNAEPLNVYLFCKENKIEESVFYSYFSCLEAVKTSIWVKFFENTVSTMEKDNVYASFSNRNKLLTLYFTFFEILTLNRSYVLFTLKENKQGLKNVKQLTDLRICFKDFVTDRFKKNDSVKNEKIQRLTKPVFSEGAWLQFLFILKFWVEDTSAGFEKTDIMIEKAVKATFDVLDTTPLESLFDLGKFIWKERAV